MSDKEIIIQLLRRAEWRLRAKQLLSKCTLNLAFVLLFLSLLKVWDLFSPFGTTTITLIFAASAVLFTGYVVWQLRKKGTLEEVAVSIDRRTGLNDEIRTAFWFIKNPRSSEWVNSQIQRAARNAKIIDVQRVYPDLIPRTTYPAGAMILVFLGLNFIPLPLNQNWLVLRAEPEPVRTVRSLQDTLRDADADVETIIAGIEEIATAFQQAERLRDVAQALMERRLDLAAEELRKLGAQLPAESEESIQDIQESIQKAAATSRPGLEPLTEDLVEMARALRNTDTVATQAALEEVAEDFEGLDEEIYRQESILDQLVPGNERRGEQDGHVPGAPIPDTRDFPQSMSGTDGVGASGGRAEAGPREGRPTTLAVKLQQEGLQGMPSPGINRVDVEEASRQERAKLDYRNVESELTSAQKDVMNQTSMPWKYRLLIKSYFEAVLEPANDK